MTDWYNELPERTRVKFDRRLVYLRQIALWQMPHYKLLSGKPLKGLGEIRWKSDNLQHRVVGFQRENREFVMLIGCTHRQNVYDPPSALKTAAARMKDVKNGEVEVRDYESECFEEEA